MKRHELKLQPRFFDPIATGLKPFELRVNDREYEVGDEVVLREYREGIGWKNNYSGRAIKASIPYLLSSPTVEEFMKREDELRDNEVLFGITRGFVILALKDIKVLDNYTTEDL